VLLAEPVAGAHLLQRPAARRVAAQHVGEELAQVLVRPVRDGDAVGADALEDLVDGLALEGQLARRQLEQGDA